MTQMPPPPIEHDPGYMPVPHHGVLILVFGILSWVVCFIFGIVAWIMANSDLRVDPGGAGGRRRSPDGRGHAQPAPGRRGVDRRRLVCGGTALLGKPSGPVLDRYGRVACGELGVGDRATG